MGHLHSSATPGSVERERLIINFHGIGEPWDGVPDDEQPYWCSSAEWLKLIEVLADLEQHTGVPLELTVDDGNSSDVDSILPVLVSRGMKATFFVCAGRLNQRHYLSEPQVCELHSAGMQIGSHGWAHRNLRALADRDLDQEVAGSRDKLSAVVGANVDAFAIPFGSYDRRVLARLREWRAVYSSDPGRATTGNRVIPRNSYVKGWTTETPFMLATDKPSVAGRCRRQVVSLIKRLR